MRFSCREPRRAASVPHHPNGMIVTGGTAMARVLAARRPLALARAQLQVLEPTVERLLPEASVTPELNVRDPAGASLRPHPVLRHAETLGNFLDG